MCWNTFIREMGKPKTATEDIRVFKVCLELETGVIESYFQSFQYRPGETYEEPCFQEYCTRVRIYGIHSYSADCTFDEIPHGDCGDFKYAVFRPGAAPTTDTSFINEWYGWHCLGVSDRDWESIRLAECVIPEGSMYCVNEFGEYISDKIRVERILTYGEWKERHPE